MLLDDFRRLGLEDRIGVIADKLPRIAYAPLWPAAQAQTIRHRTRAGCRRFEAGPIRGTPYAGEIRDGCGGFRPPPRWARPRGHPPPPRGRHPKRPRPPEPERGGVGE